VHTARQTAEHILGIQVSSAAVAGSCQWRKVARQFCQPEDTIIANKLSCHNDGRVNSPTGVESAALISGSFAMKRERQGK
jgi:hypothetical protein